MRFKIGDRVYDAADIDRVTLADILLFETQVKDFKPELDWATVQAWADEFEGLTEKQQAADPRAIWMMAVTIWVSRRAAGEKLNFGEAVDFPIGDLVALPDPADHRKPANPTKRPPRASKGSGRAPKRQPADGAKRQPARGAR